ncbi:MAG: ExbD/TolR family protein [Deltaproteobacteria bacterium]
MRFPRPESPRGLRSYSFVWIAVYLPALVLGGAFFAAALASRPALSVELPEVFSRPPGTGEWHVLCAQEAGISLDGERVLSSGLAARLRRIPAGERHILFAVDPGLSFRDVARIWRSCREAGATDIEIVSLRETP